MWATGQTQLVLIRDGTLSLQRAGNFPPSPIQNGEVQQSKVNVR